MASINALSGFLALLHGNREATITAASNAFALDFAHFARSNNRDPLNMAVKALAKGPKDKAIGEAISKGYAAAGLVSGYIGAVTGKFSAQPDNVRAMYEDAISAATTAFTETLNTSEAFTERTPKSDEEKAAAKQGKADKATEAAETLITAKVQAGELVRAADIKKITDFSALALCEALDAQHLTLSDTALEFLRALVVKVDQITAATAAHVAAAEAATLADETARIEAPAREAILASLQAGGSLDTSELRKVQKTAKAAKAKRETATA